LTVARSFSLTNVALCLEATSDGDLFSEVNGRSFEFSIECFEFNKNREGRNLSGISVGFRSISTQKTYESMCCM
jgi:hypothetical protein